MNLRPLLTPALVLLAAAAASGADILKIRTDRPGAEIQPTMYGLFFEDINYAADGGLYAEMVKNRSFEFPQNLMGWESFGKVSVRDDDGPFDRNPHYVRLLPSGHPHKSTGLTNEGFFGVAYRKGEEYRFSVWARTIGDKPSRIRVELTDPASMGETQVTASARLTIGSTDWQRYTLTLTPSETVRKGQLRIFLDSDAGCDLEHVSLFPADTWMGHENGLRKDLAQKLADIRPGVFRFPGGCIVEGTDLATRYQWKNSVGPVENRPLNENRWHYTFNHRHFPDYYQSYGLGFYEYFLLAEEIGAAPLPVISVGLACQYQNKGMDAHVPLDSLQPYIDDALDL
ncbi:MAG: carbohydrate binding domain-containing protein, partial [Duncaniella sp.]|nr:carbohydrate binding domain-containing protein [Duncaniella sp.]